MNTTEAQQSALRKATSSQSLTNYPTIYAEFMKRGIPQDQIKPRENIFTYKAWQALGRRVKKGEHGVKVVTWISAKRTKHNSNGEPEETTQTIPWSTTVFHVSQTEPIERDNHAL